MSKSYRKFGFKFILFAVMAIVSGTLIIAFLAFWQSGLWKYNPPPVPFVTEEELPRDVQHVRSKIELLIHEEQYKAAADLLRRMDITQLVEQAVQDEDRRWMAIYEDDLVLPGLDENTRVIARGNEYWVIPGTSDVLLYPEWQEAATAFAREYNSLLQKSASSAP